MFLFHSPSCLLWYPRADQKRGRRWQAVKTRLLWNSNFINICQKSPTLSLNFWNVIKRLPLSLCPKPLADVEVFSNVSLLVLSWEASTHFLENPKNSFSLQLVPKTAMKYKKEGKKGASLQQHWTELKINNMISLGFHLPSSSFWSGRSWALVPASFIFPSRLLVFMLGVSVSDVKFVWTELESDVKGCCEGWGATSLPQFSSLKPPNHIKHFVVVQNRNYLLS